MKAIKLLGALVLALGLAVVWQVTAYADGGPHGPFDELGLTTDGQTGCQSCHSPHRGTAANLLRTGSTMYDFCTSCHGGGMARTDVVAGAFVAGSGTWDTPNEYGNAAKQLNGGMFGTDAVSWHKVRGTEETTARTLWGNTAGGDGTTSTFKCTTCHDPHGKLLSGTETQPANGLRENYRLLRMGDVKTWEDDTNFGTGQIKSYTKQALSTGMNAFCASCHGDYSSATRANGTTPNGGLATSTRWVHIQGAMLNVGGNDYAATLNASTYKIPVQQTAFEGFYETSLADPTGSGQATYSTTSGSAAYASGNDLISCLTCHNAHGSKASAPVGLYADNATGNHSLQRFNERAVCQSCHNK